MKSVASSLAEHDLRTADAAQREARIRLFNDRQALLNLGFSIHLAGIAALSDVDRIRFMRLLGLPDELRLEPGYSPDTVALLEKRGYTVKRVNAQGEVAAIRWNNGWLEGAADPRTEATAEGH